MADDRDDDLISELVAAGILLVAGYGVYKVVRSIFSFTEGQTINADAIVGTAADASALAVKVAFMRYRDELFGADGVKRGCVRYGDELFDTSGRKLGHVRYGDEIYNSAGEKLGYTRYGDQLFDTSGQKVAFARYGDEIFSAGDIDLFNDYDLTLALGFGAIISRDND